eukprot:m.51859 g.51859  ORF g.51859 m.51859 type:complete len:457 (-) comp10758_c1_seq1:155-1525(-)
MAAVKRCCSKLFHRNYVTSAASFATHLRPSNGVSQTLLMNEQALNMEGEGKEVVKLGFGQSPFPPIYTAASALAKNVKNIESKNCTGYAPVAGMEGLRKEAALFHAKHHGLDTTIQPEQVVVAPGSKNILFTAMAAYKPGADVLIPAPSWVSYRPQATLLGHTVVPVETQESDRWRITADSIDAILNSRKDENARILILNYPGNPDGLTYTETEMQELAIVLRKHKVLVISDEIYGMLHHEGKHVSMAKYYPEGTIITTGLSKWCGAGGWRLGVAVLPLELLGDFKEVFLSIASETYSCAPTPVQMAAIAAYQSDHNQLDGYLQQQRLILKALGNWTAETLRTAGIRVHSPQGGFYLLPDFTDLTPIMENKGIHNSIDLCNQLLRDTGVALLPGQAFGLPEHHLSARLAYVDFNGVDALSLAQECINNNKNLSVEDVKVFDKITNGIKSIVSWCKQ